MRRSRKYGARWWMPVAVVALLALMIWANNNPGGTAVQHHSTPSYGNLLKVVTAPGTDELLLEYTGMTVSFNPSLNIPNWVSWELTRDETSGSTARSGNFSADPNITGSPQPSDYTRSGFDRGHMAPAGDMKWSGTAMGETFYMTNICPQVHSLNAGSWKRLEEKCREWARIDSAIVIVCGPVMRKRPLKHIGQNKVAVPAEFFKVIVSPYADPPRGIGFIMPNAEVKGGMQACAMSIDQVEEITGLDFFPALPDSIENIVEAQNNFHYWSTLRP